MGNLKKNYVPIFQNSDDMFWCRFFLYAVMHVILHFQKLFAIGACLDPLSLSPRICISELLGSSSKKVLMCLR